MISVKSLIIIHAREINDADHLWYWQNIRLHSLPVSDNYFAVSTYYSLTVFNIPSLVKNPSFLDTYAWVLYVKGKYKDAKKIMEKAQASLI